MACGGMIVTKKIQILEKKTFFFYLLHLIFSFYNCSIDIERGNRNILGFALIRAVLLLLILLLLLLLL